MKPGPKAGEKKAARSFTARELVRRGLFGIEFRREDGVAVFAPLPLKFNNELLEAVKAKKVRVVR